MMLVSDCIASPQQTSLGAEITEMDVSLTRGSVPAFTEDMWGSKNPTREAVFGEGFPPGTGTGSFPSNLEISSNLEIEIQSYAGKH